LPLHMCFNDVSRLWNYVGKRVTPCRVSGRFAPGHGSEAERGVAEIHPDTRHWNRRRFLESSWTLLYRKKSFNEIHFWILTRLPMQRYTISI
jgi:hypothetical protein